MARKFAARSRENNVYYTRTSRRRKTRRVVLPVSANIRFPLRGLSRIELTCDRYARRRRYRRSCRKSGGDPFKCARVRDPFASDDHDRLSAPDRAAQRRRRSRLDRQDRCSCFRREKTELTGDSGRLMWSRDFTKVDSRPLVDRLIDDKISPRHQPRSVVRALSLNLKI